MENLSMWLERQNLKLVFKINTDTFEMVKRSKGWKDKNISLAKATGYTPARISQIWGKNSSLSAELMAAIILGCGFDFSRPEEWSRLFKIVFVKKHYQEDNYPKYNGQKTYGLFSVVGVERQKDRVFALAQDVGRVLKKALDGKI